MLVGGLRVVERGEEDLVFVMAVFEAAAVVVVRVRRARLRGCEDGGMCFVAAMLSSGWWTDVTMEEIRGCGARSGLRQGTTSGLGMRQSRL